MRYQVMEQGQKVVVAKDWMLFGGRVVPAGSVGEVYRIESGYAGIKFGDLMVVDCLPNAEKFLRG